MLNPPDPKEPWIVQSLAAEAHKIFFIYDRVHVVKNIRNNWITEKTKTLTCPLMGAPGGTVAKWTDLEALFQCEEASLVKLSKLTRSTLFPSSSEKQKVSLALNVFF
ncbi:transposable element P transposase [Elysia marginata]|uniref:Transposable element P transposase n=1 Tax=Elysia marginata TaxID=1093978 RepID=A0AAV4JGD3_9GAST|nr:transposable element P transposase [Elysia marginata]